jgi:hypothetical protein
LKGNPVTARKLFELRSKLLIAELKRDEDNYFNNPDGTPCPGTGFPDFPTAINNSFEELYEDLFSNAIEESTTQFLITAAEAELLDAAIQDCMWRYEGLDAKSLVEKNICQSLASLHSLKDRLDKLFPSGEVANESEGLAKRMGRGVALGQEVGKCSPRSRGEAGVLGNDNREEKDEPNLFDL